MESPLRIEMLGGLRVRQEERVITRFATHNNGVLLAYLAFYRGRLHPRDELIEMLWPEADPTAGRNRLRQALASLRRQVEPPGSPAGSVLLADRAAIGINAAAITTDVAEFEARLQSIPAEAADTDNLDLLSRVVDSYTGPLLPGFYEEWVVQERERLTRSMLDALNRLASGYKQVGQMERAVEYARQAVRIDPLMEESHTTLIRLYLAAGQPTLAQRQYSELERMLQEQFGQSPSAAIKHLIEQAISSSRETPPLSKEPVVKKRAVSPVVAQSAASTREAVPTVPRPLDTDRNVPSEAARLRSAPRQPTGSPGVEVHLPLQFTRFFGREAEIASLLALLAEGVGYRVSGVGEEPALISANEVQPEAQNRREHPIHSIPDIADTRYPTLSFSDTRHPTPDTRLITLTGPGGCGKTRLAIEVAQRQSALYGRSAWFVPLEDIADAHLLPGAIAAAMKLPRAGETEPLEQVTQALSGRPSLLVLDNFEQLLAPRQTDDASPSTGDPFTSEISNKSVQVVRALLEQIPSLICLVTSRQLLEIAGEQEFQVQPLPVPTSSRGEREKGRRGDKDLFSAEGNSSSQRLEVKGGEQGAFSPLLPYSLSPLLTYAGVQLFMDRAQSVRPDFQITPRTAPAIAALLHRLEGLPLAIELAAAWAQTLTAAQMLERLDANLALLSSRRQDLPPRHRTLRATIDWSFQLLPLPLRSLFVQLSVFRGGWTAEMAERVCFAEEGERGKGKGESSAVATEELRRETDSVTHQELATENSVHESSSLSPFPFPLSPVHVVDQLAQLRSRSLIFSVETDEGMRFRMLEMLRGFAAERLPEQERARLAIRHAQAFAQLAEETAPQLIGAGQEVARQRLDAEHENLRAALRWALENDPEIALRLTGALWRYWALCGYFSQGREWLARALRAGTSQPARIRALTGAGVLAHHQSDYAAAQAFYEEALVLSHEIGNRSWVATTTNNLGRLAYEQGDHETARAHYEASLEIWRSAGDMQHASMALNNLGLTAWDQGDFAAAARLFEESLALKRDLGDRQGIANALNNLGLVAAGGGELLRAQSLYSEALNINQELNNRAAEAANLCNLARVVGAQGDLVQARAYHQQSLSIRSELGDKQGIAFSLEGLAELEMGFDRPESAARLLGAAAALRARIGTPVPRADRAVLERTQREARLALDDQIYTAAYTLGQASPLEQAIRNALEPI